MNPLEPVAEPFTRTELERVGFVGWCRFGELTEAAVPTDPGIYVVYRPAMGSPTTLVTSPAGHFKGSDPTVSVDRLCAKWVEGASVLYVGKATNLRRRLGQYRRFGEGQPVAHRGGRFIWQLQDSAELLVAWRLAEGDPADVEAGMLEFFVAVYGKLPFANGNVGRRRARPGAT